MDIPKLCLIDGSFPEALASAEFPGLSHLLASGRHCSNLPGNPCVALLLSKNSTDCLNLEFLIRRSGTNPWAGIAENRVGKEAFCCLWQSGADISRRVSP